LSRGFTGAITRNVDRIKLATIDALTRYSWLGNIRELQNVIQGSVVVYKKGNPQCMKPEKTENVHNQL
jgi:transcriptional regulator with PAS, ATPase and Fis domain